MRCELYYTCTCKINYLIFMYKKMNFMKILSHKMFPLLALYGNVYCTVVSAMAFYKHQPVLSFLHEVLDADINTIRRLLSDSQRIRFAKEIKG